MPPKAAAEGNDNRQTVIALCNMMISCSEFKIDSHALAPILGVSHAKNVARKINTLISPFGFEYKANKIIRKDGDVDAPATPTKAVDDSTPASAPGKVATTKTPASRRKKAASTDATETKTKTVKTRVTKKRKLENVSPDEEDDDELDTEGTPDAMKAEKIVNAKVEVDVKDEAVVKAEPEDIKAESKDVIDSEDHPMSHVADDFEDNIVKAEDKSASIKDESESEGVAGPEED